jgi:D-aminopeptidase
MSNPRPRARDVGIRIGSLPTGPLNSITDVAGVRVGHTTLIEGEGELVPGVGPIRTGVTAIIPHARDLFLEKPTGAVVRINGFGEVTNTEQIHEMGVIEGPIMITNTLNVPRVADAVIDWMLDRHAGMGIKTYGISPVVAETWDGYLNDIRGRHVHREHVIHAIESATDGVVEEGPVGGGTGMICFEFKGGIGTSSRRLDETNGGYTVGVLVQTNFGDRPDLMIDGVPVGRELEHYEERVRRVTHGSVIVVIGTDAPMTHRQLTRMGMRAAHGLARTGSHGGNTSGDFAIAFSNTRMRPHRSTTRTLQLEQVVEDTALIGLLFSAVVEATEEAVLNSLFKATTVTGRDRHVVHALPIDETVEILRSYGHTEVGARRAASERGN